MCLYVLSFAKPPFSLGYCGAFTKNEIFVMIRSLLEKLARNKMVQRTLPNGAKLYVSPDAALQYLKPAFGQDLTEIAKQYIDESSVVWDVGANCGVFSFSSINAREIVAFEADPFLCHMMLLSNTLNDNKVNVVTAAIANDTKVVQFNIAKRGRCSNFITEHKGRSQAGGVRYSFSVPTMTLDSMLETFSPPTFLKIDVEGAELDTLKGAQKVLKDARPLIFLEAGRQHQEQCRQILEDAGYDIDVKNDLNWFCTPRADR